MTSTNDLQTMLSSKTASFLSWVSAGLGLGTFMGWVNLAVGVLSGCWLIVTLWNYFTHTRRKNKMEIEQSKLELELLRCRLTSEKEVSSVQN